MKDPITDAERATAERVLRALGLEQVDPRFDSYTKRLDPFIYGAIARVVAAMRGVDEDEA